MERRGDRLLECTKLVSEPRFQLQKNSDEGQYLGACKTAQNERDRKKEEESKRKIRDAEQLAEAQAEKAQVFKRGLVVGVVLLVGMVGAVWYAFDQKQEAVSQYTQAEASLIWNKLVFSSAPISIGEKEALWRLAVADRPIKNATLKQLLGAEELSVIFARKPREVTRALVGLDTKYRQRIIQDYLAPHPKRDEKIMNPLSAAFLRTSWTQ